MTFREALAADMEVEGMHRRLADAQIFGGLGKIDALAGSISFVLVILCVLFLELVINKLAEVNSDTPYGNILSSIQKELMVVGSMAFALKCIIFTTSFEKKWLVAIEFADLVIPITAFFCAVQGILLVILAKSDERGIRRAFDGSMWEMLELFYTHRDARMFSTRWLPCSTAESMIEMQVARYLCLDDFGLTLNEMEFDDYLMKVNTKYIIGLTDIAPANWGLLIVFVCVNWIRLAADVVSSGQCKYNDLRCINHNDITVFTFMGCMIFLVVFALAVAGRYYHLQLYHLHGVKDHADYLLRRNTKTAHEIRAEEAARVQSKTIHRPRANTLGAMAMRFDMLMHKVKFRQSMRVIKESKRRNSTVELVMSRLMTVVTYFRLEVYEASGEWTTTALRMFLLEDPNLYFKAIDHMLIIIAFYLSLWVVQFTYASNEFGEPEGSGWRFYSLAPGLASLVLYVFVVRSAFHLKSVTFKDSNLISEVKEERRLVQEMDDQIRQKLLEKFAIPVVTMSDDSTVVLDHKSGEIKLQLANIFSRICKDDEMTLGREELKGFLNDIMDIPISEKLWKHVFRHINRNHDNRVNVEEFMMFLLPNDKDLQNRAKEIENVMLEHVRRLTELNRNEINHLKGMTPSGSMTSLVLAREKRQSRSLESSARTRDEENQGSIAGAKEDEDTRPASLSF